MASELGIWKRLQAETPKFFKRVIKVSIAVAAIGLAIKNAPAVVPGFILSAKLAAYCNYAIVAGLVAGVISKATMTDSPAENSKP